MIKYPIVEYKTFEDNIKRYELTSTKLDMIYNISDHRYWSAIINFGKENILVTFHVNKSNIGNRYFDLISSDRVITNVLVEDIYDTIDMLINKQYELQVLNIHE